jgi:hypothetical protein
MTRIDKLTEYLADLTTYAHANGTADIDFTAHATTLLTVCAPTAYASIKDVADLTGRTKGTILSWIQRGQHDCPPALGTSSAGMVWDLDDWKRWAEAHPGLVYQDAGRTDLV